MTAPTTERSRSSQRRDRASSQAFRYALRELRGGLRGFYVFVACIALGVFAIAGVGALSASLSDSLEREREGADF